MRVPDELLDKIAARIRINRVVEETLRCWSPFARCPDDCPICADEADTEL